MKHIGKNIKSIREEKSLAQQQMADLIAMYCSNYSKVGSGKHILSLEAMSKIAKYFAMKIDGLVPR